MQPRTLCLGESRAADESQPEHEEAYRRKPPNTYAYTSVPSARSVVSHTKQYAANAWAPARALSASRSSQYTSRRRMDFPGAILEARPPLSPPPPTADLRLAAAVRLILRLLLRGARRDAARVDEVGPEPLDDARLEVERLGRVRDGPRRGLPHARPPFRRTGRCRSRRCSHGRRVHPCARLWSVA